VEYCSVVQETKPTYWIGDTGATSHMINSTEWLDDVVDIDIKVELGNGSVVTATKMGNYHGTVVQVDGTTSPIVLTNVKYIPELKSNLLSITTAINHGWSLGSEGKVITLQKNGTKVKFDHVKSTGSGLTAEVEIVPNVEKSLAVGELDTKIDVDVLHRLLGHPSENKTRTTAQKMNVELTGKFSTCEYCVKGKARQKKVAKSTEKQSTHPFEKLYVDISTMATTSVGGKKNWVLIVDEFTHMKWSIFLKNKSEFPQKMVNFVKKMSNENHQLKLIRLDNSGENAKFQELLADNNFGHILFQYTAPRTPQHNGVVERAFATLLGRMRAMMSAAGLS
jgi:hypothetical protein